MSAFVLEDQMLPEVRMARIMDALLLHRATRSRCVEAAELLGGAGQRFSQVKPGGMAGGRMSDGELTRLISVGRPGPEGEPYPFLDTELEVYLPRVGELGNGKIAGHRGDRSR